jgi:phosphoserine phosphatase
MSEPTTAPSPVEPNHDGQAFLVWVTGQDRPGIAAGVLEIVARSDAWVQDIEQLTLRGRIILGLALDVPRGADLLKDLLWFGWKNDLDVDFQAVSHESTPRAIGHVVTVLGRELSADSLRAAAQAVTDSGANIDRVVRLAKYPVFSYELIVRGGDTDLLRTNLMEAASDNPHLDVAVQREGLRRRAKRLVVLDVDSTLIQNEVIDLLAEEAGVGDACRAITERAMAGELDFREALVERVGLLAGASAAIIDRARTQLTLTPGARTFVRTLKRLGFRIAIVSGGFSVFTDDLRVELGLDHAYGNELEVIDGVITGRVVGPVVDRERKAELLRSIAEAEGVPLDQTVAVGDGANDLDMLAAAGLGIAFNAKSVVNDAADTAVSVPYLDAILFVLGVSRDDIEEADTEAFGGPLQYPAV